MAKKTAEKEIILLKKEIAIAIPESWLLNVTYSRIDDSIINILEEVGIKSTSVEDLKLICKQIAKNTGKRVSISKSDAPYKLRRKLINLLGGDLLAQEMLKKALAAARSEMVAEVQDDLNNFLVDAPGHAVEAFEYSDHIEYELFEPQLRKVFKECGFDFNKAKQQLEDKKADAALVSAKALLESRGFNVTIATPIEESTKKLVQRSTEKTKRT